MITTSSGLVAPAAPALCFDNQSLPDPITVATEDQETVLWRQKLAVGGVAVGPMLPADCLFNWAERTLGQYFAPAGARSEALSGTPSYYYRYFSGTGNYLGVNLSDNHLYAVGLATGGNLIDLGPCRAGPGLGRVSVVGTRKPDLGPSRPTAQQLIQNSRLTTSS
ncbi:MAG: hypothetical protein IPF55_11730 [Rhodoferax sp.]|nr:hypothetical protein [Rhodoferax sp.]